MPSNLNPDFRQAQYRMWADEQIIRPSKIIVRDQCLRKIAAMMTALAFYDPARNKAHQFHTHLNHFNSNRLTPALLRPEWQANLRTEYETSVDEGLFVEHERHLIQRSARDAPEEPEAFLRWFEELRESGYGQNDSLFPWLGSDATLEEMRWFLAQEAAGEAGFDDLVALTQVRCPVRAKLEMARNYWDEMGRGHERGMHGPMLAAAVTVLDLEPSVDKTVWEALALSNLMAALASNRRYAYQSVGALGAIEMTAPGRVVHINAGLKRLGVPKEARAYFQLHAGLDIEHSKAWNKEVIYSLVKTDASTARPIAEGALMRLASGARCFRRYRAHFGHS